MKNCLRGITLLFGLLLAMQLLLPQAAAASPSYIVVNWGDTLYSVAVRNGTTVAALVRANGLPNANFIYAGQRLVIPTGNAVPGAPAPVPALSAGVYTVVRGDTLATIAGRYGTTVAAIMRVNNLYNPNFIYTGQRLNVPGNPVPPAPPASSAPAPAPATGDSAPAPSTGRWIDINISTQTITAYEGNAPVKSVLVSTGVSWYPTPIGHYKIYMKLASQTMSGGVGADAYYLPNVPWVMYFAGANAIHGTYWHHNFGHPMSHGCVNLTIDDAKWFYSWADIGTPVITHL